MNDSQAADFQYVVASEGVGDREEHFLLQIKKAFLETFRSKILIKVGIVL
jgi:hypothetical protein